MDKFSFLSGLFLVVYGLLFFVNGFFQPIRPFDFIVAGSMIIVSLIGIVLGLKIQSKISKYVVSALHFCTLIFACLVFLSLGISEA